MACVKSPQPAPSLLSPTGSPNKPRAMPRSFFAVARDEDGRPIEKSSYQDSRHSRPSRISNNQPNRSSPTSAYPLTSTNTRPTHLPSIRETDDRLESRTRRPTDARSCTYKNQNQNQNRTRRGPNCTNQREQHPDKRNSHSRDPYSTRDNYYRPNPDSDRAHSRPRTANSEPVPSSDRGQPPPHRRHRQKRRREPTILSRTDLRTSVDPTRLVDGSQTVTLQADGRYVPRQYPPEKDIDVLSIPDVGEAVFTALAQFRIAMTNALNSNLCDEEGEVIDKKYLMDRAEERQKKRAHEAQTAKAKLPKSSHEFFQDLMKKNLQQTSEKIEMLRVAKETGAPNPLSLPPRRTRAERERARAAGEVRPAHPQSNTRPLPGLGLGANRSSRPFRLSNSASRERSSTRGETVSTLRKRPCEEVIELDSDVEVVNVRNVRPKRSLSTSRANNSSSMNPSRRFQQTRLTLPSTSSSVSSSGRSSFFMARSTNSSANSMGRSRRPAAPRMKSLSANPQREARRQRLLSRIRK